MVGRSALRGECLSICHLPELKTSRITTAKKAFSSSSLSKIDRGTKTFTLKLLQDMVKRVKLAFDRYLKRQQWASKW